MDASGAAIGEPTGWVRDRSRKDRHRRQPSTTPEGTQAGRGPGTGQRGGPPGAGPAIRACRLPVAARCRVDGKFFSAAGERFEFRGVTYGTFAPREDGALFPERERLERDLASMRAAGFTVVRTYTLPPE